MFRFSIRTRGLILVGFPLICQLVFIAILMFFLWQMQEDMRKRTESRELVAEVSRLNEELLEMSISFNLSTGAGDDQRKIKQVDAFEEHLQQIEAMASRRSQRDNDVETLRHEAQELRALFNRWRQQQYAPGYAHVRDVSLYKETKQHFKICATALHSIIADEESLYSRTPNQATTATHDIKKEIRLLFIVAALSSAAGAIVLGILFARLIREPISQLSTNVRLLSKRESLKLILDTGDEFATLDKALHDVSNSIERASNDARALVDNAQDLVCSLQKDGTFVSANHYASTLLGLTKEELIGKSLVEIVPASLVPEAQRQFETARTERTQRNFELALIRKDGTTVDTRWSSFWSSNDDSMFSVVNDITEQRRAERLKHDFVETIRQDLQAPLTSIVGSLAILERKASGEAPQRLQSMSKNLDRLIELVDALLESQKYTSSQMQLRLESCNLQKLVTDAVDLVRELAVAKKLKLEISSNDKLAVLCDKQKLQEVIVNLLGNAIKFSPTKSSIEISFEEIQDQIELKIRDHGPGVPQEYRESIFQAFEQTPDARATRQGVGLGLAICKLIVQAHQGTIGVRAVTKFESMGHDEQIGSTFWFRVQRVSPN